MESLEARVVALVEELQDALGATSVRIEAWMPVIETVSITLEDGAWVVSDRGETHGWLSRGDDDTYARWNPSVVENVCRDRRVEVVVEPEGDGFADRIVLVRRPAGSHGLVEAATALSEAIDEIFGAHLVVGVEDAT